MTHTVNTQEGFSCHVEFSDLENLGWDFESLYQSVAIQQDLSREEAEAWEKENCHIRLFNNGNGVKWIPSNNVFGDTGDCEDPGDDEKTIEDIQDLYDSGLLWELFEGN